MRGFSQLFAGLIFLTVAFMHLIRLFYPYPIIIGTWFVPLWASFIGFFIAGYFAGWIWRLKERESS